MSAPQTKGERSSLSPPWAAGPAKSRSPHSTTATTFPPGLAWPGRGPRTPTDPTAPARQRAAARTPRRGEPGAERLGPPRTGSGAARPESPGWTSRPGRRTPPRPRRAPPPAPQRRGRPARASPWKRRPRRRGASIGVPRSPPPTSAEQPPAPLRPASPLSPPAPAAGPRPCPAPRRRTPRAAAARVSPAPPQRRARPAGASFSRRRGRGRDRRQRAALLSAAESRARRPQFVRSEAGWRPGLPSPPRSSAPPRHRGRETRLGPHLAPALLAAGFHVSPTARRAASHRGAGAQSCRPSLARGGDTRRPLPLSTFWCRCSARPAAARVLPARGVPTVTFPATPCSRGLSPTPAALPGRVPLGARGSSGASPPAAVLLQRGASSFGQKPAGVLVC